jgi:DNA-binding NtrC family response regulator
VLAATRGNKSEAARVLGISRKNLYEKLARFVKDEGGRTKGDEGAAGRG